MRRRLVTVAISLGLALGAPAFGVVAGTAPLACAATDQRAVLVVDTGSAARSYCVALGSDAVSGTDLIRLAHEQYGLDYRLGFGGRAVCRLSGVGVDGGDCFGAYPDFWGYWHGSGGGWTWAGGSAADWTVEPGDVEGWQWGPGQDGQTHAPPPATRIDEVCRTEPEPPEPTPPPTGGGGSGGEDREGGAGGGSDGPAGSGDAAASPSSAPARSEKDREPQDRTRSDATPVATPPPSSSPTGAPSVELAAGSTGPGGGGGGAGAGALAAVGAVAVLGAAGAWVVRRRRTV